MRFFQFLEFFFNFVLFLEPSTVSVSAIVCGSVGTAILLLAALILIVRSRCGGGKESESEREKYYAEEEALIARKKGVSAQSYNISSNRLPNNKLKNYNNIHNSDRRNSQVLIVNPIVNPISHPMSHPKLYKPTVPDNPHVTIHNNLKSSGTEI